MPRKTKVNSHVRTIAPTNTDLVGCISANLGLKTKTLSSLRIRIEKGLPYRAIESLCYELSKKTRKPSPRVGRGYKRKNVKHFKLVSLDFERTPLTSQS